MCATKLARRAMIGDQAEDGLISKMMNAQPSHQPSSSTDRNVFYRSLLDSGRMGDHDSLPEQPEPRLWSAVAADRFTCTVKACPQFQTCSYYQARRALARVDVIVANHDLVLASIGARTLPELNNCLVAFDEGHNLPKTAIEQFASKMICPACGGSWTSFPRR
jgi:Rad3-related DNA helicase